MYRKILLVSGLLLLVILTACSGNTTVGPSVSASPTYVGYSLPPTPAHVGAPLAGDYLTTITRQDGTPAIGAPAVIVQTSVGSLSTGERLISFRKDGYFTAQGPNSNTSAQYVGLGQYAVKGNLLTVQDVKCWEFNGIEAYTATYRWVLQEQTLLLAAVGQDICSIRALLLTSHPLNKQS